MTGSLEKAILGSIVAYPELIHVVVDALGRKPLFSPNLQKLYDMIVVRWEQGLPVDLVTLTDVGPETPDQILKLTQAATSSAETLRGYCLTLLDDAARRSLVELAKKASYLARGKDLPTEQILRSLQAELGSLETNFGGSGYDSCDVAVRATLEGIQNGIQGVKTGFYQLDEMLVCLANGDLVVLAGRPSSGKTALALAIADHAISRGEGVGFFSLEMASNQLIGRLLSKRAKINGQLIRSGRLTERELFALRKAGDALSRQPLYIDDRAAISGPQIASMARKMRQEHSVQVFFVDYLQLVQTSETKGKTREREVAEVSRELKILAKELQAPVVALSQLSRQTETRTDKRPILSDLRDSGAIEQDADVVLFVHNPKTSDSRIRDAEIIVAKQRNGPIGITTLQFAEDTAEFRNTVIGPSGDAPW